MSLVAQIENLRALWPWHLTSVCQPKFILVLIWELVFLSQPQSSNSHLSLQHLALALVSFYISGLRKDWISHLIKRDCIACCFLFLLLFPCAQAAFLLSCLVLSLDTRHFRDRQELGSYNIDSQALHQPFHHKQNPPLVLTPASASSILCSLAEHSHLEYTITFRNRIPWMFQWMPSQTDYIFFTLVERRWVTILKHAIFVSFFFFPFYPISSMFTPPWGIFGGKWGGSVSWHPQMHKIFVKLYGFLESKVFFFFFFFWIAQRPIHCQSKKEWS